ncbi:MAG: DNA-processing protein DprA [Gemmatimonadota bacterium]|nr:DNA-processing protein DprA [Gemmatimonadota bacterium]
MTFGGAADRAFGVAVPDSAEWPRALASIQSPPRAVYFLGAVSVLSRPCVAIVGSRQPTAYGERVTRELAVALATAGACVVSGMAFGIDAAAHRAALDCGGVTAAVLGAGIDIIYPRSHAALYEDIAQCGVVVSEFPQGKEGFPGCFPRRNRIIAGLCGLTIVVEAGLRSGALITATHAADFGRNVAAVPGQIDSPQSQGSNQLLRDGAHVIASVEDALALANLSASAAARPLPSLGADEAAVWDAVTQMSAETADEVIGRTGWPASRTLAALTQLEIQGLLECSPSGMISRR